MEILFFICGLILGSVLDEADRERQPDQFTAIEQPAAPSDVAALPGAHPTGNIDGPDQPDTGGSDVYPWERH